MLNSADPAQSMQLTIGLNLRSGTDIDGFLNALYDPQSPYYHHYVTPDQFTQMFSPTSDQVQQVVTYLQGQGFTVTNVAPNNLLIDATASVGQVQKSFRTQIKNYKLGNKVFHANDAPPSVPNSVGSLISSIDGLDNSTPDQPLYSHALTHTQHSRSVQSGPIGGLMPSDFLNAYDMAPLQANGILGDNQTIGIFELDGYQTSDVNQYFQNYGITPPSISNVLVDGFSGNAGQGAIEAELDIEVAGAVAPHAKQIIYEGPNTTPGINDTYNKIVTDNKVQIASISWGICENSTGNPELQTMDNIFKQGAAQGISFIAASGDSGAYDCADTNLNVDSPADDPYVTGVGATTLQENNGTYVSESSWSDPLQILHGPKGAGSGGGLSTLFKIPSWQSGPGVQNQYSNGYREVPDVTAAGDSKPGYSIFCTVINAGCPITGWLTMGGTSGAAPLWASGLILVNQYLLANNTSVIGHSNPTLYHLFNTSQQYPPFHDVTSGNNLHYPATTGYDFASGIGSPDLFNIARDLVVPAQITPTPTPTTAPTATPTTAPTATPTSAPSPSSTPTGTPSLIDNGGFENGSTSWTEQSGQGSELVDSTNPHTGQNSVYLCGYTGCDDRISQTFSAPAAGTYNTLTLTYWYDSDTSKTSTQCQDYFTVRLANTKGGGSHTLQQDCNTDVTNGWTQMTIDITSAVASFKGKPIVLTFRGTNNSADQTTDFYIDDVAITAS
jgi:kumamolisin